MKIKRGDDFILALQVTIAGVVQDITGWVIEAKVASRVGLPNIPAGFTWKKVADLSVNDLEPLTGQYVLSANTSTWPAGTLYYDIRYTTDAGQKVTTESIRIDVETGPTGDATP